VDGRDYYFVDEEEFARVRDSNGLLEWAEVYGYHYGTPREAVERKLGEGYDVILEIDVQGGVQVKGSFENVVMIFIVPPSLEELERRLRGRGTDSEEVIATRLKKAKEELEYYKEYEYIVVNDQIERCLGDVTSIITAERLKKGRTRVSW